MAERETVLNGVTSTETEDPTADSFYDPDQNNKVDELSLKIELLEQENREMKERIKILTIDMEACEEDKKVFDTIAARAVELETEVSRLQHDLITAMSEGDEASAEVAELKKSLGEKGVKLEELEREIDELKNAKAEGEKKGRELERKVGLLEVREIEEKSKRIRVEEDMREKIHEKEKEISGFKKKVNDLETELDKLKLEKKSLEETFKESQRKSKETVNGLETELDNWKLEKKSVEETLKESKRKSKEMEVKIVELQKEIEEARTVITGLKEKTLEALNGDERDATVKSIVDDGEKRYNWHLPVVAATASVAAVAVVGVCYARRG